MRRALAVLLVAFVTTPARARTEPAFPLLVERQAVLAGSPEVVVELRNQTDVTVAGAVELTGMQYRGTFGGSEPQVTAEMPFALGPHATGRVVLVAPRPDRYDLGARVRLDDGRTQESAGTGGPSGGYGAHGFVDLGGHRALLGALHEARIPSSTGSPEVVSATAPSTTSAGSVTLPTTLAGYAGAALVHVELRQLIALGEPHLQALVDWTARGGTLALSVDDDSALADPKVVALLGGRVSAAAAEPGAYGDAPLLSRENTRGDEAAAAPAPRTAESPSLALRAFVGGNGVPSPFGTTAAYGVGRVVLLPFRTGLAADDPWAMGKLAELTVAATLHQKSHVTRIAQTGDVDDGDVKHALDPNQGFRVSLGAATALLLVYAGVLAYLLIRDHKQRRLFRPFVWLPILAGSVSLAIVLIGFATRGAQRGVRRILVLETGAGFGLVSVDEYRGYFTSGSDLLTLQAHSPRSLLTSAALEPVHQRDGASFLRGKPQLPWQTTVTRELRVEQSSQDVAVGEHDGVPWIANHTTATLEDALITSESGTMYLLPRIAPGETIEAVDAQIVSRTPAPMYRFTAHALPDISAADADRLDDRYAVYAALAGESFVAPGTTSLVALATGEVPYVADARSSSELPMKTLATFVHVVGRGGAR